MTRLQLCTLFGMVLVGGAACGKDGREVSMQTPQAPADAMPASVVVPGGDVVIGTRIGSKWVSVPVETIRFSRTPITVGQWKTCMQYGACGVPELTAGACAPRDPEAPAVDGPTLDRGLDDIPLTCVSLTQANGYCDFAHHGRVPSVQELLLALRGPTVQRFPWGDARAGCEHRPRLTFAHDVTGACCGEDCTSAAVFRVGIRPAGDSPYGVSDVLATHAELAMSAPNSAVAACRGKAGCVLAGLEPAAIDWILPLGEAEEPTGGKSAPYAAGFRCAWTGEVSP
jgi:hypothetical protein